MSIIEKLNKLVELKNDLVENLNAKNIPSTEDEKFNTLVPKVLDMGSDATATAEDIAVGKTAYTSSGKVTGTKEETVQNVEWVTENNSEIPTILYSSSVTVNNVSIPASTLINYIESIRIPKYITEINISAFSNCKTLKTVDFLEPSSLTTIKPVSFTRCTSLTDVTFPSSLTSIGGGAFQGCSSLSSVNFRTKNGVSSLISIDGGAFDSCTSLLSINLPSSLTSIGGGTFSGCTSLSSIVLRSSLTSIGSGAFQNCTSLKTINGDCMKYDNENITKIEGNTFYNCESLETISIPKNVTSLGSGAFQNCKSLRQIEFSNVVTVIDKNCFNGCENLDAIYYHDSGTYSCSYIGSNGIKEYYTVPNDEWDSITKNDGWNSSMGSAVASGTKIYSSVTGKIFYVYFTGSADEWKTHVSTHSYNFSDGAVVWSLTTNNCIGRYLSVTDEELEYYISGNVHNHGTVIYSVETGDVLYTYA